MIDLIEHIEYLIRRHDCVIVPGFGAFLADYMPAHIADDGLRFMPPKRMVAFNSQVMHNDGLLVTSLMRRHRLTYATATGAVESAVEAFRSRIEATGCLSIGRLGHFVKQDSGSPLFAPSDTNNPADIFNGLPAVELTPVVAAARKEAGIRQATDPTSLSDYEMPGAMRGWLSGSIGSWKRIAAAVAVIGICSLAFILGGRPGGGHSAGPEFAAVGASFIRPSERGHLTGDLYIAYPDPSTSTAVVRPSVPEPRSPQSSVSQTVSENSGSSSSRINRSAQPEPAAEKAATPKSAQPQTPAKKSVTAGDKTYCLVVASLPDEASARKFINNDGNSNLKIVKMDGRFRVYIASSTDRAQLTRQQPSVADRYRGAWICAMP